VRGTVWRSALLPRTTRAESDHGALRDEDRVFDELLEINVVDRVVDPVVDDEATLVVHLMGELDMASAPRLWEAFAALPAGVAVVVDLGDLVFMDVAGLRPLLDLAGRRSVRLVRPRPIVRRLLVALGADRRLGIDPEEVGG